MIKEFALEPDVLAASFRDFSYFLEKFGVAKGRVISRFPKEWKRMVYNAAQAQLHGTRELSLIEVRLKAITEEVLFHSGRPGGGGTQSWFDRALVEHHRQPFDGIIATANPTAHANVLVSGELDESDVRFQGVGQRHITRTAREIVDCVDWLLGTSKTVKLIDPHFKASEPRWRRMFEFVMATMSSGGRAGITLEIHRADNALPRNLQSYFDSVVPSILPAGICVQVFLHPENVMHNRFILTDLGGVSYQTGLDDNEDGGSTPTDLVTLLEPRIFSSEWAAYRSHQPFLVYP